ncbi:hypothetical protein M3197_06555 [Sporosarcina aquimarina]|uniref:hypothetical protein n=1 Tax=Sporosarcina aquimarina TaxID=114975 RepID=UPI002041384C|nr:hypothetical protein [Sporosarcina aquimarina]MCM3757148.1 hypothetical protein [Sporosarcina aquimarina]
MKENLKLALIVSLFSLIGLPIFFLILSITTGNWKFFLFSLAPALTAGLSGLLLTLQRIRQTKQVNIR